MILVMEQGDPGSWSQVWVFGVMSVAVILIGGLGGPGPTAWGNFYPWH